MRGMWTRVLALVIACGLFLGCGTKSQEEKIEQAGKKVSQASEKLAQGQGSPEELAQAMKNMGTALGGGKRVDPIDFRELKAMLPESLAGLKRTAADGEKAGAFGVTTSTAHARYESEDGEKTLELRIQDMGTLSGGVGAMAVAWAFVDVDQESDSGYEKTTKLSGYKALEKYDRNEQTGSIQVVVGNRFIVAADGSHLTADDLKSAIGKVDLAKLDSRKNEGVQKE